MSASASYSMDDFAEQSSKDPAVAAPVESEEEDSVEEEISEHSENYSEDFQEATADGESLRDSRRYDRSCSVIEDLCSATAEALEALREEEESAEQRQEAEAERRAKVEERRQMLAAAKAGGQTQSEPGSPTVGIAGQPKSQPSSPVVGIAGAQSASLHSEVKSQSGSAAKKGTNVDASEGEDVEEEMASEDEEAYETQDFEADESATSHSQVPVCSGKDQSSSSGLPEEEAPEAQREDSRGRGDAEDDDSNEEEQAASHRSLEEELRQSMSQLEVASESAAALAEEDGGKSSSGATSQRREASQASAQSHSPKKATTPSHAASSVHFNLPVPPTLGEKAEERQQESPARTAPSAKLQQEEAVASSPTQAPHKEELPQLSQPPEPKQQQSPEPKPRQSPETKLQKPSLSSVSTPPPQRDAPVQHAAPEGPAEDAVSRGTPAKLQRSARSVTIDSPAQKASSEEVSLLLSTSLALEQPVSEATVVLEEDPACPGSDEQQASRKLSTVEPQVAKAATPDRGPGLLARSTAAKEGNSCSAKDNMEGESTQEPSTQWYDGDSRHKEWSQWHDDDWQQKDSWWSDYGNQWRSWGKAGDDSGAAWKGQSYGEHDDRWRTFSSHTWQRSDAGWKSYDSWTGNSEAWTSREGRTGIGMRSAEAGSWQQQPRQTSESPKLATRRPAPAALSGSLCAQEWRWGPTEQLSNSRREQSLLFGQSSMMQAGNLSKIVHPASMLSSFQWDNPNVEVAEEEDGAPPSSISLPREPDPAELPGTSLLKESWSVPGGGSGPPPSTRPGRWSLCDEMLWAVANVAHDMLEIKHNVQLDAADFVNKAAAISKSLSLVTLHELVGSLNAAKASTTYRDSRGSRGLRLQFKCRELHTFEELRQLMRLLPGTACAIAVLEHSAGVDFVAAFRLAYADSNLIVGRHGGKADEPLCSFGEMQFSRALALDVDLLPAKAAAVPGGGLYSLPKGAQEALAARFTPGDENDPPLVLLSEVHPTVEAIGKMVAILSSSGVGALVVNEVLIRMAAWLKEESTATQAQSSLYANRCHASLLTILETYPVEAEICTAVCRVIGWASHNHVHNAVAFVHASAVEALCRLLERHGQDRELHRHGLYALGCCVHFGSGASHAKSADASQIVLQSVKSHRASRSVQINACEVLRSLADDGVTPVDDFARAGLWVKQNFPADVAVHRSADNLLAVVVPRIVGAVGSLMDSDLISVDTQLHGTQKLGDMASYGSMAWKAAVAAAAAGRVLRALATHASNTSMQAIGLWALGRLAERVDAPSAGMLDAADMARKKHPKSALVCRCAEDLRTCLQVRYDMFTTSRMRQ